MSNDSHGSHDTHSDGHSVVGAQHHVTSPLTYTLVFFGLLILMGATVGVSYVHLGTVVNNVVAMAIAVLKASLVVAIFMGVAHGTKLIKFWAISGLSAITLFAWVFIDYASRTPEVVPGFYHDEGSAMHSGNLPNDPSTMQPTPKTEGEKGE